MAPFRFVGKQVTKDVQGGLHDGWKIHNGWHRGSLRLALRVLREPQGILHYTPSILLCKTSVMSVINSCNEAYSCFPFHPS